MAGTKGDRMSTNYARAKYQEIYDVNTRSNEVSIIGIHTPTGAKPRQMLAGFFTQFRKFKYSGCSVVATPAQRLGLNLAQLSVEAGTSGVNPKDVFNPILVRGCHGDNLNSALNSIYKGSFENAGSSIDMDQHSDSVVPAGNLTWEQMYYRMLQDPSFKKFSINSGIKLSGLRPMVYNVASNHQIMPNTYRDGVGRLGPATVSEGKAVAWYPETGGIISDGVGGDVAIYPQLMTNRLQKLGWMDTRQVINAHTVPEGKSSANEPAFTTLPKIFMSVICLPPAKSADIVTSMRFVVTHYFEFKEFNTSLTLEGASEYYDWLSVTSSKMNDTLDTNGELDSVEIVSDGVY